MLSVLLWSIVVVVSLKYAVLIMRADNGSGKNLGRYAASWIAC